jgi:hypothetical protein
MRAENCLVALVAYATVCDDKSNWDVFATKHFMKQPIVTLHLLDLLVAYAIKE